MRITLIALLLAGVVGCDSEPDDRAVIRFEEPKPESGNGGDKKPGPEFEAILKAAEQGDAIAQDDLGYMYEYGECVPVDKAEAYAWISVAATNGDEHAKERLPKAKAKLTPEQLTEGQKLAIERFEQIPKIKAELTPKQVVDKLLEELNANKAK